jgi:putative ABC transport system permease protein
MRRFALYLKLAAKNAVKYRRRTLQSGLAIFLGVLLVALADAYVAGFSAQILEGFVADGGHLVASAPGYAARAEMMPLDKSITDSEQAGKALRSASPALRVYASIRTAGLVSPADGSGDSATIVCSGIEAYDRSLLSPALAELARGMVAGSFLPPQGRGMVLSDQVARRIGAVPGDRLVFLCADRYDSFSAGELELLGVYAGKPSFSAEAGYVDLESLRAIVGLEGEASQLTVYALDPGTGAVLDPRGASGPVAAAEAKAEAMGLEATRWDEASKAIASMLGFMDAFMYIICAMFAVVAVVGIANSVLISVQDRIRDFGTLRAIAFTRGEVSLMIVAEVLFVGAIASALAVGIAAAVALYLQDNAVALPRAVTDVAGWMPRDLRPLARPLRLAAIFAGGVLVPPLASLYPIGMIRRMSVREALGYV